MLNCVKVITSVKIEDYVTKIKVVIKIVVVVSCVIEKDKSKKNIKSARIEKFI